MKISSSFGIEIGMQQLIKNGRKCLLQNIIDTIPFGSGFWLKLQTKSEKAPCVPKSSA